MEHIFLDRTDAGRRLSQRLEKSVPPDAVILAIPRGGIPVAVEVALRLNLRLDIIVLGKLPIPWNPEAGFGAITAEGDLVLNEPIISELGLSKEQVEAIALGVKKTVSQRKRMYRGDSKPLDLSGKTAYIIDDGLASGYTMLAAVRTASRRGAVRVVVAVPVASESALRIVTGAVDEIICLIESHNLPFAVADYYAAWHDVTDEEAMGHLARMGWLSEKRA